MNMQICSSIPKSGSNFRKLYDEKGIAGSSASLVMQAPAGPGNGYEGWSTWQPTYEIVKLFQNADGTPYKPAETKPFTILQTTIDPDSGEATQKKSLYRHQM